MLCLGKTDFTDIETRREDVLFRWSLELSKVPSEECLRKRFNGLGQNEAVFTAVDAANLGTSGYMLANELRPGSQHSQK